MEKITTAEAIRVLVDYYHTSDYYYTAKAKVEEISQFVSTLCSFIELLFDFRTSLDLASFNPFPPFSVDRKGLFLTLEAARLVSFCRPTL